MKFPLLFGLVLAFALISCRNTAQTTVQFSKLPVISDDSLLTLVEYQTFRYFWDRAEPNSGMACERVNANDIYLPIKTPTARIILALGIRQIIIQPQVLKI